MPNYPIPPWLKPISPVEPFLQGAALAQRQQAEENALAMQRQQLEARRQESARRVAEQDRDYALRRAQADAEMNLRTQSLAQSGALQARRMQAAQAIENDIARGVEPAAAYARHLPSLTVGQPFTAAGLNLIDPTLRKAQIEQADARTAALETRRMLDANKLELQKMADTPGELIQQDLPNGVTAYWMKGSKQAHFIQGGKEPTVSALTQIATRLSGSELGETAEAMLREQLKKQTAAPAPVRAPVPPIQVAAQLAPAPIETTTTPAAPSKPSIEQARKEARQALDRGANPNKVRARFKQLYGEEL